MKNMDLIARYDGRVPRYTSYPTAPHFSGAIGPETYAGWLETLPGGPLSLYIHVPFCERLCLYCGCNTAVVRQERPRRAYAGLLARELEMVAARVGHRRPVAHIHWGGGTPTSLPADCLVELMGLIRALFSVGPAAEVAIELDPASMDEERAAALGQMRITRASLGVQDFDAGVQAAIGRVQSFEETRECAAAARAAGAGSLNLDLIYGLPNQTVASVERTAALALELGAERISVFGYAHVPWMKRHQALIAEAALPGPGARFAQMQAIGAVLRDGGFAQVGLDHYARPDDALAKAAAAGRLRRNFQGYTTDESETLIGIGASAIGALAQGYAQNAAGVPAYGAAIGGGRFAVERGVALSLEDRLRRAVIERIMCDMAVDLPGEAAAWGMEAGGLLAAAAGLGRFVRDGLVRWDGARVEVTALGRPFLRNVAALFDAYLAADEESPRHARAV